jgi:phosphomannomutase
MTKKGVNGAQEIVAMMSYLRDHTPKMIGAHRVVGLRDVLKGTVVVDGNTSPLDLPKSNVLIFDLEGGARVIARPSGTEPKIKFYVDLSVTMTAAETYEQANERAQHELQEMIKSFLALLP